MAFSAGFSAIFSAGFSGSFIASVTGFSCLFGEESCSKSDEPLEPLLPFFIARLKSPFLIISSCTSIFEAFSIRLPRRSISSGCSIGSTVCDWAASTRYLVFFSAGGVRASISISAGVFGLSFSGSALHLKYSIDTSGKMQ